MRKTSTLSQSRILSLLERDRRSTARVLDCVSDILIGLRYEDRPWFDKNIIKKAKKVLQLLHAELFHHCCVEEKIVFPFAKSHLPKLESVIRFLEAEHQDFKKHVRHLNHLFNHPSNMSAGEESGAWIQKVNEAGNYFIYLLRRHLEVRHENIDKAIDQELREDEKRELANRLKGLAPEAARRS